MKSIVILSAALILSGNAYAQQSRCKPDYAGNMRCTVENQYGHQERWRSKQDYNGNQRWISDSGQIIRCKTRYDGTVICR